MLAPFIAARHIISRRRQTILSVIAVALAVSISIIFTSLANGQQQILTDLVSEKLPHVTVSPKQGDDYIHLYRSLLDRIRTINGLRSDASSLSTTATFSYKEKTKNALLKGIVPADEDRILQISTSMVAGDFYGIQEQKNVVIGFALADLLKVKMRDKIQATFPKARTTDLTVVGIFDTGTPLDEKAAFISLETSREFLGEGDVVNAVEIQTDDIYRAEEVASLISSWGYNAKSWQQTNPEILRAIRVGGFWTRVSIILVMVIAFFGIASIMNLLVQEKTREIGMLMALGSSRANIRNIFLYESGMLGLIGAVAGCILGLAGTYGLGSLKFELAAGGREITSLPLILNPWDFIGFTILAVGLSLIAGVYPAIKASHLDPVIALKGG